MSHDEKQALKDELLADFREQLTDLLVEIKKPKYKGLLEKFKDTASALIIYATFALVSGGSLWGWNKAKEFSKLPQTVQEAKADLSKQIADSDKLHEITFETKESHLRDTSEIKKMVEEGKTAQSKIQFTLDEQGRQLSNMTNSIQSIQTAINNRNLRPN